MDHHHDEEDDVETDYEFEEDEDAFEDDVELTMNSKKTKRPSTSNLLLYNCTQRRN
jgi:hypothetical protein